jgi:asparagine synthase (glutamine-hydrolysing)
MCGIAGIASPQPDRAIAEVCTTMRDAMAHRGPDDAGTYLNDDRCVALGSRRLAIIDLSPAGHQPMLSPDGRLAIVFNGEIYNYRELRADLVGRGQRLVSDSDTEVILHLYRERGADCLTQLNGMFGLALWDASTQRLLLARDRLGKKPLVYAHLTDGSLAFASEFQALLRHPGIRPQVNLEALDYFLRFGYVPAPLSGFAGIAKLEPGQRLRWQAGNISLDKYWQPPRPSPRAVSDEQASAEFVELFDDSVRRRMISDVPLGAFLSGGIDSASVVASMAAQSDRPVKTFSIGFGSELYDELPLARLVARRFSTDHQEFVVEPRAADVLPDLVRHYGEPYADSSALPTYYLARLTRQHVTVALNGDGGDELLAGYDRYRAALAAERIDRFVPAPKAFYRLAAAALPPGRDLRTPRTRLHRFLAGLALSGGGRYSRWMSVFDSELLDASRTPEFAHATRQSGAAAYLTGPLDRRNGTPLLESLTRLDLTTYLPGDLLVKADIATMASSLEGRSPFLDYRLIEWAASLPPTLKLRGQTSKYLLRQTMRARLPAATLASPKRGFGVPVAEWLRGELRPMLEATVLSDRALGRDYLQPSAVRRLVADHLSGQADHAKQLWALLTLERWHQAFLDRPLPSTSVASLASR